MSLLDRLQEMTVIVADTGDIESIRRHRPRDATTNPSLLLAAARMPQYRHLVEAALAGCSSAPSCSTSDRRDCLEKLSVNFGREILGIIPGRVSVEVDASLSFDAAGTLAAARRLISLFEASGIARERVLIKIAATWEGITAARQLEREEIRCNLTLLFSFAQAAACAEAGVRLISPFVGRILDWHQAQLGVEKIPPTEDPGVASVQRIYNYYRCLGYETEVMGASFRNIGEILELAGCDLLTISPQLLRELESRDGDLPRRLDPGRAREMDLERVILDEKEFRWLLNEDAMATEKLSEGIRKFHADTLLLLDYLEGLLAERS